MVLPDTSILVAAFCDWHEHHEIALKALAAAEKRGSLIVAIPVVIEIYAVMTRLPAPHRLAPQSALDLIRSNLQTSPLAAIQSRGFWNMLEQFAGKGIAGGTTYDALIVACAVQAGARALLTLNRRDFTRIVPEEISVECPIPEGSS